MEAAPTLPHPNVLTCEDLLRATGYKQVSELRRCLDELHVRYFTGKGGRVWTTIDLVNAAGGLVPHAGAASNQPLDPADFQ